MNTISQHFQAAQQKIEQLFESQKREILKKCKQRRDEVVDFTKNPNFSRFAVANLSTEKLAEMSENESVPELVRIGEFTSKEQANLILPCLLPYPSFNATALQTNSLMDILAVRFMLALPRHLSKFYLVDNNFGQDFARINQIKEEVVDKQTLTSQELNQFLIELTQTITERNKNCLTSASSLSEYNQKAGDKKEPYYFVFIPNFPTGFTAETTEKLSNIINNGNAAKAGVYIFFSINKENEIPFGDWKRILKTVTFADISNNKLFSENFQRNFTLLLDTPNNVVEMIGILNARKATIQEISFEKEYELKLKKNDFWKNQTTDNLKIPIGFLNVHQKQYIDWGQHTNNYFGLIGGLPGTGKTVLLHNIIMWGAIEYSPFELQYYLIDCKNGTGMNVYKELPHTKVLSSSNDRSFGESAFVKLIDEMKQRAELFKKASAEKGVQIENIHTYRKETGKAMPRILTVIDEFQVLFEKEDKISSNIGAAMDKIFREGRAFGIHFLLCSQGIKKIYNLNINNVTWRLSFKLQSQEEALRILGNEAPLKLSKIGNAIINDQNGEKNQNINFQVGSINNINPFIDSIKKAFGEKYPKESIDIIVNDGNTHGKVENNTVLKEKTLRDTFKTNDRFCDIFLGEPTAIRNQHTFIRIRKQASSNVLIVGNNLQSAVSIVGMLNYQIAKQSSATSKFYIVDCFNIDNQFSEGFEFARHYLPNQLLVLYSKGISNVIDEIDAELTHRIAQEEIGEKTTDRRVLSILYGQNCRNLRKDGYNESPVTKKLKKIIKEGPEYGIHVLLHSLNYQGYADMFDRTPDVEFENRIALDNNDATKRIIANSFGAEIKEQYSALLQAPDEIAANNPELFRVYAEFNIAEKETKSANKNNTDFVTNLMNLVNTDIL